MMTRTAIPVENNLAESGVRVPSRAICLVRTCPRTVVEVLTRGGGVRCYRADFAILRKREVVSHTANYQCCVGLTGQRPPALAGFESLDFESPNKFLHFMVQEVGGWSSVGSKAWLSVCGAEVSRVEEVYE